MDRSPSQDLYARLGRNIGYLAGGTGAAALLNVGALAFNARALSVEEFGTLVLLQSAAVTLSGLTSFSTQQPVIKLGTERLDRGDLTGLADIVRLGLIFDLAAALLASAAAFLIITFGADLVGIPAERVRAATLFAASLLFTGYATSNGLFRLFDRFGLMSLVEAATAAALLACSMLLYFIDSPFLAYAWMWAVLLALNSQAKLWTSLFLLKRAGVCLAFGSGRMSVREVRTFVAYCWTTWGTSSAGTLRMAGDSLLVGAVVSVEAAGIYNVAKQVAGMLRKLTSIYGSAVFPEISVLAARGDLQGARKLRARMILLGLAVGCIALAAAAVVGRQLLAVVFGPAFALGYPALVALTAAGAAELISHTYSIYVQVFLGPTRLFVLYLLATAAAIGSALPLTFFLGIAGTALAQIVFAMTLILLCGSALGRSRWQVGSADDASGGS